MAAPELARHQHMFHSSEGGAGQESEQAARRRWLAFFPCACEGHVSWGLILQWGTGENSGTWEGPLSAHV